VSVVAPLTSRIETLEAENMEPLCTSCVMVEAARTFAKDMQPRGTSSDADSADRERLMRAFRISVALAMIAATSWLMTHQTQAPSVYGPARPASHERVADI
jgi:hypothetical protein